MQLRQPRVAVVGSGSWGTTVASIVARSAATTIWARSPEVAAESNEAHTNRRYLGDIELHAPLQATASLQAATEDADGVGAGFNTKAMVMTRALRELTRLGEALGGHRDTFAGLAGMGDLTVTCMSPLSRNRHVGEGLGRGQTIEEVLAGMTQVAEGVKATPVAVKLAAEVGVDVPIAQEVHGVLKGGATVADA